MTTPAPATSTAPAPSGPTASGTPGTAPSKRLPNGGLRRMVARVLADRAHIDMTPGDVARVLGRSPGAVKNALDTLTGTGHAEVTTTKPMRYTATATTADAATGAVVPTTAPAAPAKPAPAKPAPATPAAPAPVGPVTRPNGLTYHPRALSGAAGIPDVVALQRLRDAGVPALLYGPPGTGKTSVIEAAFGDLLTVQGDGDTTVADITGEYTQTPDGRFEFIHGPLPRAMREGRVLFIDDATLISPSVLAVVYPAMDGRKEIIIKANGGEVITAEPGFYVVAGHNPGVHGAILTDALSSRFAMQIQVSTDYTLATQLKIDKRAVRAAMNLDARKSKGEVSWAPQLRELISYQKIADVLGAEAAAANLVGIAPEEDRDTVADVVRTCFGHPVTPVALGARV